MGRKTACSKCGKQKESSYLNAGYCKECSNAKNKESRENAKLGIFSERKRGRTPLCARCKEVKEYLKGTYCNKCKSAIRYLRAGKCPCGADRLPNSDYCRECKNRNGREWQKTQQWTEEDRLKFQQRYRSDEIFRTKSKARRNANYAKQTGKLERKPCEGCGSSVGVEMHHKDYTRALDVVWLCNECHDRLHYESKT